MGVVGGGEPKGSKKETEFQTAGQEGEACCNYKEGNQKASWVKYHSAKPRRGEEVSQGLREEVAISGFNWYFLLNHLQWARQIAIKLEQVNLQNRCEGSRKNRHMMFKQLP